MSILSSFFEDIRRLIFPVVCPVCGALIEDDDWLCTLCRMTAPFTYFWTECDNLMTRRLWGVLPLVNASAFIYFVDKSGWRSLIHGFKYRGSWRQALDMGRWYGSYLADGGLYSDVDVVIPIPLHVRKLLRRGYNQSEYIARGIATELGVVLDCGSVVRSRNNKSQALSHRSERWDNVQNVFSVVARSALDGKHILLVDDVFTTGATILSCAEQILKEVPSCRISIVALAVSKVGLNALD